MSVHNPAVSSSVNPEGIIIWDENHQFSVINLVPKQMRERMLQCKREEPQFFDMDEHELLKELRHRRHTPSTVDHRLRLKFWIEYDRAISEYSGISMTRVFENICASSIFHDNIMKRPHRAAWILLPPMNYADRIVEALNYGLDQMRDILAADMFDVNGKIDHKLAALKMGVFKMLDDRSNGVAIQRLEKKTLEIKASVSGHEMRDIRLLAETMSTDQLKEKLGVQLKVERHDMKKARELEAKDKPQVVEILNNADRE